jgi:hypothetical protein
MANGQGQVYRIPAYAVEGSLGSVSAINPVEALPGVICKDIIKAGHFVFKASAPADEDDGAGIRQFGSNNGAGLTAADIIGIAYRNQIAVLAADEGYSQAFNAGQPAPVATAQAVWVKAQNAAAIGNKAFAVLADGSVKFGAAGAVISGAVETDWIVVKAQNGGAIGDLILIKRTAI